MMRIIYIYVGLVTMILFSGSVASAQRKWALLVGVSDYGHPYGSDTEWQNISGANDVELLQPLLLVQGFQTDALVNSQATYARILECLKILIRSCKEGDCVYLHFSMHGQPVEDRNGDESDGWDESLIPVDARKIYQKGVYEGECHLTDDCLETMVDQIRKKIGVFGKVYVVLDACHSGESSRGDTDYMRGTHQGFTWTGKTYKASRLNSSNDYFRVKDIAGWAPVVYLEACRSYQHNKEIRDKACNKWYGALSYFVAEAIRTTPVCSGQWIGRVKERMDRYRPNKQNMVIESSIK